MIDMEWNKCSERMPHAGTGRYLIMTKCNHKTHKAIAINWAYPCNKVNIAYYDNFNKWHYESGLKWEPAIEVTHWAEIMEPSKD